MRAGRCSSSRRRGGRGSCMSRGGAMDFNTRLVFIDISKS
jgi:hypothetical protein